MTWYLIEVGRRAAAHLRQAWHHGRGLYENVRDVAGYGALAKDYLKVFCIFYQSIT